MDPTQPSRRMHLIERPRIERRLALRFEHRVTTMIAPAGAGKTSAIALAIENNRLDPRGRDLYVPLSTAIEDPVDLHTAVLRQAGSEPVGGETLDRLRRSLVDLVWAAAPDELAVTLDDAHLLGSAAVGELAWLTAELPSNGHLVLLSRHEVAVPLARLRAHRNVLAIDDAELDLDDDELTELRAARQTLDDGADDIELPRHAATADLRLAAGSSASADFLHEEVLTGIDADRLGALRRLAVLDDDFDDDFVELFTDHRFGADELLRGLPLVERRTDGTYRLHALLRDALARDHPAADRRKAASLAADLRYERGLHVAAIRLHLVANDEIGAREVARGFINSPTVSQTSPAIAEVTRLVEQIDRDGPLLEILRVARRHNGLEPAMVDDMRAAAASARRHGDAELEALALHRAFQAQFADLDGDAVEGEHLDRLVELAEVVPFARGALAHVRSQLAQHVGDVDTAMRELADYELLGPAGHIVSMSQRLIDLGHPERVGEGLTPSQLADLPEGYEVFVAYAMWLRGEESPEFAHEFVEAMLVEMEARGVREGVIAMLSVATSIALAAGDDAAARRRSELANSLIGPSEDRGSEVFGDIAAASVAAVVESDERAAEMLAASVATTRSPVWPSRAQLLALPLAYALQPGFRPTLDRMRVGRSLTIALDAGRALVALRDGDATLAARLPWSKMNVLRVHVLPHHLVELACAAIHEGTDAATDALAAIPNLDRNLGRVVAEGRSVASEQAAELLGQRRPEAPHTVELRLLGPVTLMRNGVEVVDADWVRRVRVRELLALLAERRRLTRHELLGAMWGDHDDDHKADTNLRTTMSRLQRVLEPERGSNEPYFLRSVGDLVTLHGDVATDVDEFERLIGEARRADDAGTPARALDRYRAALDLYRGDYVHGFDVGWAVLTRTRLRALAVNAMCRVGELVAARGEPEEAARWAQRALDADELSERAAMLFVAALGASGDRAAAARSVGLMTQRFADHGIDIGRDAHRVFDRWR
ncbi:BTAD domain-containing putative transcriptional regulator [Ilumatobacter coccineus]|uniref:Bacterial transcriptional activator domain-containing protein n=1 Tax=Ilumatobacter coccineus (strain NBRC 103263 / KCTC 29153 / YM16-304) TaxID=1313172 RepID=A0A6C7E2M9_ILUCY|nr:BTAD domain-containing putative transcriptional regulator [Ilumatobacter coccineus]BAN00702.1 hypothetical protein YM304_03880 [Ilumatobacter coccineus YM16-304]